MPKDEKLHLSLHTSNGGKSGTNPASGSVGAVGSVSTVCTGSLIAEGIRKGTFTSGEWKLIFGALVARLVENRTLTTLLELTANYHSQGNLGLTCRFEDHFTYTNIKRK